MTAEELLDDLRGEFSRRKFAAGLLVALIDLYIELDVPALGASSFEEVTKRFRRQERLRNGNLANTLILERNTDGDTISIRPFYNAVERLFHATHKRFDYPTCAPHATQAWPDYVKWLDSLALLTMGDLRRLRESVIAFVLEALPSHEFDPSTVEIDPPLFLMLLDEFDLSQHEGEISGAAYQGVVFGFLRADNPHLQVEIDKVRAGSRRRQRIGDIDGWEGSRLAVSAEVKQLEYSSERVLDLERFANEVSVRNAIGLLVALRFGDGAREAIEDLGLHALDQSDLHGMVELWDPMKQRIAVTSLLYYVEHVERNDALARRLAAFISEKQTSWSENHAD